MMHKLFFLLPCFLFSQEDVSSMSEAIGRMVGKHLEQLGVDFDVDALVKGLQEELLQERPLDEQALIRTVQSAQQKKILEITESALQNFNTFFNGDPILEHDSYSFSTPDPSEHGEHCSNLLRDSN